MKKSILIPAFLFIHSAFCQTPADKWFFGVNAGVDFTFAVPTAFTFSPVNTPEGCASICDNAGGVLFYTDGITVWNKNNLVMPNGTGLLAGSSSTQAALIVPQPGSSSLFYLFTTDEAGGANGLRYSIVDMNLQGGMGDVTVAKNILIQNNVTEKLTAVSEMLSNNYRVAVHEWGTNAFHVYTLSSSGLSANAVVSNAGIVHNTSQIQNTYGQMKFSPCGDKLALAAGYLDTVEIFDFDAATGIVSNAVTLPMSDHVYGLEFSADGRYLYVSNYNPAGTLVQFDISSGVAATILASMVVLSNTPDTYALQLAPDGKIYVCKSFSYYLGVINNPTAGGISCNYVDNGLLLDPNFLLITSALGLPAFPQSFFRDESLCPLTGIDALNNQLPENIFPNPSYDEFSISFQPGNTENEISVSDCSGRQLVSISDFSNQKLFSFGKNFAPGIYFIRIKEKTSENIFKAVKLKN